MKKLLLIFLTLLIVAPVSAANDDVMAFRTELYDAIAELREKYHCEVPKFDDNLNNAAQRQAEYLTVLGVMDSKGPNGENAHTRAADAGYGGSGSFEIKEALARVWVDTDVDYLVNQVWKPDQISVRALLNNEAKHIGIGVADAADKHRYIVVMMGSLSDGGTIYTAAPTYDFRTPKPALSYTPTPAPMIVSTAAEDGGIMHEVQAGETFSEIALAYGLDWYTLASRNYIKLVENTPVVVYEGQVLVIQPTFTLTPTPTATKTPLPPTNTPRPTFTVMSVSVIDEQTNHGLPAPDFTEPAQRVVTLFSRWQKPVGALLIMLSALGLAFEITRKKKG